MNSETVVRDGKHDWKRDEKKLYLPRENPESIIVPPMKYFVLQGQGNPNNAFFGEYIEALFGAAYRLRMSDKSNSAPEGFFEYTVYPLEGVWDLTEAGKAKLAEAGASGDVSQVKDDFVFSLMIRQPDFVTDEWVRKNLPMLAEKKKNKLIEEIQLVTVEEGLCVHMLHNGPYDSEPESFLAMEAFCASNQLKRIGKSHREIYLSDARKTAPEKLRTVLRISVESVD